MKKTTIRELRHETTKVLSMVEKGESVEVYRRNLWVAVLTPPAKKAKVERPDFKERLLSIYGIKQLPTTGTDLIEELRGER